MLEIFNALLAVPGAILAIDDLANELLGSGQNDDEKRSNLEKLRSKMSELHCHLERFAGFGPEMQAWKEAHHVTSLIMVECEDIFRLVDQGRASFQQMNERKWRMIRAELSTMRRPRIGSITYLSAHSNPDLFSIVTNPNDFPPSPRWDEYIIDLEQTCKNWLDSGNRADLYETFFLGFIYELDPTRDPA